jgi:hypothetical protein
LTIRWPGPTFGLRAAASPFFALSPIVMTEQNQQSPEQLLTQILLPGESLTAFKVEMDEQAKASLEENRKKQMEALKRKDVDENLLRLVVKF